MIHKLFICLLTTLFSSWFMVQNTQAQSFLIDANMPYEQAQSPPPLGPGCSGLGLSIGSDELVCCVSGYVYVDGEPIAGANVVITVPNGKQTNIITAIPENSDDEALPYFDRKLNSPELNVKAGDAVTITASYNGISKTDNFIAKERESQIDVVLPKSGNHALPIATISYVSLERVYQSETIYYYYVYQHETIYFEGRGADSDASDIIATHRWTHNGKTISQQAHFSMTAGTLPVGLQEIRYDVQDDEGHWSNKQTATIEVHESKVIYLPTIMR